MNDTRFTELEQRLRELEAEVSRLRAKRSKPFALGLFGLAGVSGCALAFLATVMLSPAPTRADNEKVGTLTILEAPLVIRDKNGKTILNVESTPAPCLQVFGDKGSVKVLVNETGGAVSIRNGGAGSTPCAFCFDTNGDGMVFTVDKGGKRTAEMTKGGVSAFNDGEKAVATIGASPKGNGTLKIGNAGGDSLVEAGVLDGRGIVRAYPYNPKVGDVLKGSNLIIGAKQ